MAKTTGPLISIDARGNFAGGAIQFRGGLKGTHAYRPKAPKTVNQAPPTQKQTKVRNAYAEILAEWRTLSEQDKIEWDVLAAESGRPVTGWNLFVQSRMPAVLSEPELPDPNTYTAPSADNITFPGTIWHGTGAYIPPSADNINF